MFIPTGLSAIPALMSDKEKKKKLPKWFERIINAVIIIGILVNAGALLVLFTL